MTTEQEVKIPIIFKKNFNDTINYFINEYPLEIGGWIKGTISKEGIICEELLIPEQEVGGSDVDISPKGLALLRKEYGNKCKNIIGEWHSHNTMSAFWSSTDETLIKEYSEDRDISIFIVSSKGDGHLVRLEVNKPFKMSINKLDYEVEQDSELVEKLKKEIEDKLKEKKFASSYNYGWDYKDKQSNLEIIPKKNTIEDRIVFNEKHSVVIAKNISNYFADTIYSNLDVRPQNKKMKINDLGSMDMFIKVSDKSEGDRIINLIEDMLETLESNSEPEYKNYYGMEGY